MHGDSRREFLRFGLAAFGSLSLPALYRLRAAAPAAKSGGRTAVIVVWLRGGCSHLDTYDPKPDAPAEYRGPLGTIATRTPGLRLTELLPRHAEVSDRFTVLRSMAHTGGGHPAGSLQLLSGDPDPQDKPGPALPDLMSVAHRLRYDPRRALPNYVGVNPVASYDGFGIAGPAYLGRAYAPFAVTGDPSAPDFRVQNVGLADAGEPGRFAGRAELHKSLGSLRGGLDRSPAAAGMDRFQEQAVNLLTSPEAARAFDLSLESPKVRDRYGRNAWGQQLLMARRLVEAGSRSSRPSCPGRCAGGSATGTTTRSTTTSSTR